MTVYVVGLDGADWSLLRPWMAAGDLPAFSRVADEGVVGGLRSTLPPVTFPAWKCYSTGKNPGKLGVYEWFGYDRDAHAIEANDASDFRSREYWDAFAAEGGRAAVVNMPTTHPPANRAEDGTLVVAGSPASERDAFTAPASLKDDLLSAVPDYRVKPDLVLGEASPADLVAEGRTLVDQRFDAAEWLARERERDLVHLTVFVTDTLQHRLWDRPERLRALYERVDDRLGDLLDADDTDAVFLMSDHGFVGIDEVFLVNQWLLDRGDLALGGEGGTGRARAALAAAGVTEERLKRAVGRLGLVSLAQSLVPASAQRFFPSESGHVAIQDAPIDWDHTRAVSLGRGPIYLDRAAFDDADERERYREELATALEGVETPAGDPVADAVHPAEAVYEYDGDPSRAPDLVVEYAEGVDAPEAVGGDVFGERTEWLATHRRTGVFGAWGEEVGSDEADLSIYDLAPTILHRLGAAVPADVDGEVRRDVLAGAAAERETEVGPPTATGERGGETAGREVEETLRDLGYM